ncbi:MAG: hypothetical protein SFZ02_18035 [bacterium]|nr:hypothetical protein [bacterium]
MTACEGQATPFPAQIASPTPDESVIANTPASATQAPTIRYAIDPSLTGIFINEDDSYQIIPMTTPLLTTDLGISYDVAIRLGDADGWLRSPMPLTIGLLLRPSADFVDILWRATDPTTFIDGFGINGVLALHDGTTPYTVVRTDMANLGKPDGFTVNMGILGIIGENALRAQFGTFFIETRSIPISLDNRLIALQTGEIDLMLVSWFTDSEKSEWVALVGEENLLPLFTVPISYIARPDLTISLSPQGLPQVDD